MNNYVACKRCKDWNFECQMAMDCQVCNNKRFVIVPEEQLCNNCGDSLCPLDNNDINYQIPHGLSNATVIGGYSSYHLLDGSKYTFSMCEKCLRQMFISFKIKPSLIDAMDYVLDDNETAWNKDQMYYEYRVWKDAGLHKEAYKNDKCNFVKDCQNDAIYSQYLSNDFTEMCCCEEHKGLRNYSNSQLKPFVSNVLKPFL